VRANHSTVALPLIEMEPSTVSLDALYAMGETGTVCNTYESVIKIKRATSPKQNGMKGRENDSLRLIDK
jgi:hypothetical protein